MTPQDKPLTQQDFRARLDQLGLMLNDKAFAAAWAGAQHLRGEVARLQTLMRDVQDE